MYRVELKVEIPHTPLKLHYEFLMYRVELKEFYANYLGETKTYVPNVPCGVERVLCKLPWRD